MSLFLSHGQSGAMGTDIFVGQYNKKSIDLFKQQALKGRFADFTKTNFFVAIGSAQSLEV